jgi:hypothetical protein
MYLCSENLLKVASLVFKNFNYSDKVNVGTFKNLYNIYRAWYRILKYISRGYLFVDMDQLLNLEF